MSRAYKSYRDGHPDSVTAARPRVTANMSGGGGLLKPGSPNQVREAGATGVLIWSRSSALTTPTHTHSHRGRLSPVSHQACSAAHPTLVDTRR
ncbi:hypothetical protein RRG08_021557 [Elysia crispata]|uniref:Uncharacterized protein n=1 Tax=Elysia crispata TaxID=231223 RepID=A0AAE0XE49_9GAST|nr:hypothetical protein RRG08_021557 [Elysia crispata]